MYDILLIGKLLWVPLAIINEVNFLHQIIKIEKLFEETDFKLSQLGQLVNKKIEIKFKVVRFT